MGRLDTTRGVTFCLRVARSGVFSVLLSLGCGAKNDPAREAGEGTAPAPTATTDASASDAGADYGTTCASGAYIARRDSSGAIEACTACPSGWFSAESNLPVCTPWRECSPGSFVRNEGSSIRIASVYTPALPSYDGGTKYLGGRLGFVRVYAKALSSAEALQNFNALRARFGL
jgi:hypothetical protein